MSKNRKQRQAEQLGMPIGTARSRLQRKVIWDLLNRAGENQCSRCGDWITSPEDLAITHTEPWLDNDPELFWDTRNVTFMHLCCAAEDGAERDAARWQKEDDMSLVDVRIINDRGDSLPGCWHDGKVYVAGAHGERYKIFLRNRTEERVEVVLTVDGRDVITGEVGSTNNRGYILGKREYCEIDGWRTSDTTVAAFRFGGDKNKAYSTQLGTGAHLGVIGVAVYEERPKPKRTPAVFRTSSVRPRSFGSSDGAKGVDWGDDSAAVYSASLGSCFESTRGGGRIASVQPTREEVKLGTQFGEEHHSAISTTRFTRRTLGPVWTLVIEYDTFKNLKRRGVPIGRRREPKPTPSPFPGDSSYCKPPPRR